MYVHGRLERPLEKSTRMLGVHCSYVYRRVMDIYVRMEECMCCVKVQYSCAGLCCVGVWLLSLSLSLSLY
jgi:hypothetical protein